VAHLLAAAHVDPDAAAVAQLVTLARIQPRHPFEPVQLSQLGRVNPIDLALQHGSGVVGGHRHRKGAQVVQVQPAQLGSSSKVRPRQSLVIRHSPFEAAVDEHQLLRLMRLLRLLRGRIGADCGIHHDDCVADCPGGVAGADGCDCAPS